MYWYLPWAITFGFWDGVMGRERFLVVPMEPRDLDFAAELHSEIFARPWSGDEFAALLSERGVFGFVARPAGLGKGEPAGFVLARKAADEAEILTIAVDPRMRRMGIARLLMDNVLQHLYAERAKSLFLEVDEENAAALNLYRRLRFNEVGRRPAYYTDKTGKHSNALVLKRDLS